MKYLHIILSLLSLTSTGMTATDEIYDETVELSNVKCDYSSSKPYLCGKHEVQVQQRIFD